MTQFTWPRPGVKTTADQLREEVDRLRRICDGLRRRISELEADADDDDDAGADLYDDDDQYEHHVPAELEALLVEAELGWRNLTPVPVLLAARGFRGKDPEYAIERLVYLASLGQAELTPETIRDAIEMGVKA